MALRVLISAEQIRARIAEMGAEIDRDYASGQLHLVCILKGACFFLADLARAIQRDATIEFMGISSYGRGKAGRYRCDYCEQIQVHPCGGHSGAAGCDCR